MLSFSEKLKKLFPLINLFNLLIYLFYYNEEGLRFCNNGQFNQNYEPFPKAPICSEDIFQPLAGRQANSIWR